MERLSLIFNIFAEDKVSTLCCVYQIYYFTNCYSLPCCICL